MGIAILSFFTVIIILIGGFFMFYAPSVFVLLSACTLLIILWMPIYLMWLFCFIFITLPITIIKESCKIIQIKDVK